MAVSTLRQAYGIELDYAPASLRRLDEIVLDRLFPGEYARERFPAMLALTIGAYTGEVLRRAVGDGMWGAIDEDLYGTPLPFLLFARGEYSRQVNVVEDIMTFLWMRDSAPPGEYVREHLTVLRRLGITAE